MTKNGTRKPQATGFDFQFFNKTIKWKTYLDFDKIIENLNSNGNEKAPPRRMFHRR
jgi:hypothetical protein